ncbi:MAG: hypothetical protein ACJ74O_09665 [Frankiaceae bacterium]
MAGDDDLLDSLSRDLVRAHGHVSRIEDGATRARLSRRLIAITNAAKHDLPAAGRRLRELLRMLDSAADPRTATDPPTGTDPTGSRNDRPSTAPDRPETSD